MEEVLFNFFLYGVTLLIYTFIRRKIDVGFVILSVYAISALFCVLYFNDNQNDWKLNLWSFIYLYVIVILAITPFLLDTNTIVDKVKIRNVNFISKFIYLYCACALVDMYFGTSNAIQNINSGEWALLRMDLYAGELKLYNNQLERFVRIFVSYLKPLAIIFLFISLRHKNINRKWIIILIFSIVFTTFLTAINVASRGLIFSLLVSFVCAFLLFRNELSRKNKKNIYILGLSLLILILIFSLAVTKSRFGDDNSSSNFLFYFGHSMLTFNYGLTDSIEVFGNGTFFLDWFVKLLGYEPINTANLGTHFGTKFFTFVGSWYIDFGPNGTFLIALVVLFYFINMIKKKVISIAELYIIFFYLNYLVMGVFVVGRGNSLAWLISFTIYYLLKIKKI